MYWIIFIGIAIASYLVQANLQSKFNKYAKIATPGRVRGCDVARKMLEDYGVHGVRITCIEGQLTDHYNPENKTVNLSKDVYKGSNITAAAVAAHECGHAVQHAQAYAPVKMRSALVPAVQFSSKIVSWVLLLGIALIQTFPGVMLAGIVLFALTTLFSIVTLPVEIDASRRALAWLDHSGLAVKGTAEPARNALKAAAYTYVVAAVSSIGTLIYYLMIFNSRR